MTALEEFPIDHAGQSEVEKRVWALAAGLRELRLADGGIVLIVTCADHDVDRVVAERAAGRANLVPQPMTPTSPGLHAAVAARPALVLACRHGSAAVAATKLPCRIYGDRPGMAWWRALEVWHWPAGDGAWPGVATAARRRGNPENGQS